VAYEALKKIVKRVSRYFVIILLTIIISSAFSYFIAVYNDNFRNSILLELKIKHTSDPDIQELMGKGWTEYVEAKNLIKKRAEDDLEKIRNNTLSMIEYSFRRAIEVLSFKFYTIDLKDVKKCFIYSLASISAILIPMTGLGVVLGALSTRNERGLLSKIIMFLGPAMTSLPVWWIAILIVFYLIVLNTIVIKTFFHPDVLSWSIILRKLGIMALSSGIIGMFPVAHITRSVMIREKRSDYVLLFRAIGLKERRISRKVLRTTLPGVASGILSMTTEIMVMLIGLEITLAYPGIGHLIYNSFKVTVASVGGDNVVVVTFIPEWFIVGAYLFAIIYAFVDIILEIIVLGLTPYENV